MKLITTKQNNQAAIASQDYSLLETSDKLSGEGMDNVLKYADNPLDEKPGTIVINASNGTNNNYNNSVVVLNWSLS
ncbi:fucose-binding lectin II [Photorhabdus sp. SF281]|uniref:fucose-binding lectin II n=1 Tax=Photorhabdus sp. SF281 TaxID=3459527 RepID=UPI0040439D77